MPNPYDREIMNMQFADICENSLIDVWQRASEEDRPRSSFFATPERGYI